MCKALRHHLFQPLVHLSGCVWGFRTLGPASQAGPLLQVGLSRVSSLGMCSCPSSICQGPPTLQQLLTPHSRGCSSSLQAWLQTGGPWLPGTQLWALSPRHVQCLRNQHLAPPLSVVCLTNKSRSDLVFRVSSLKEAWISAISPVLWKTPCAVLSRCDIRIFIF